MADALMTVAVDARALVAALDRLGAAAERHIEAAARTTAEAIAREARARVARRTGETQRGIGIEVAQRGPGFIVYAQNLEMPGLPGWLEFGTERMTARPFFFAAAALEEGAHDRRIRQAVQDAIDETGLGD